MAEETKTKCNIYRVPIVNVIYDLFFDEPPTMDQIYAIMSTFGLLNGLMVGVSAALMNLFGPEDAEKIHTRFETWKANPEWKEKLTICPSSMACSDPYDDYLQRAGLAFQMLGGALLMLIVTYLGTAAISFGEDEARGRRAWWQFARWIFIVMLFLTAGGLFLVIVAVQSAFVCQNAITPEITFELVDRTVTFDLIILAGIGFGLPLLLMSIGLMRRETVHGRVSIVEKVPSTSSESPAVAEDSAARPAGDPAAI